jgi:hypothetical protein
VSVPPNTLSAIRFGGAFVGTYFFIACCLINAKSCWRSPACGPRSSNR